MQLSDIQKLAELARIRVTADEEQELLAELDPVLDYVSEIKEATSSGAGEHDYGHLVNVHLREDGEPHEPGIHTKDIIDEVPASEKGYVKVRKVL